MAHATFVTFGDSRRYARSVKRLKQEAESLGIFDKVYAWHEKDIAAEFVEKHKHFMMSNARGMGYWIWKPQVILQALKSTPTGGFVLYADAGCCFIPKYKDRIQHYFDLAAQQQQSPGVMAFQLSYIEKQFSKMDTVVKIFPEQQERLNAFNTPHNMATVIAFYNTPSTITFVEEWLDLCICDNYKYVSDIASQATNSRYFVEHRHDQSIFSLLVKKYKCCVIPDETWHNHIQLQGWPIHAARIRC